MYKIIIDSCGELTDKMKKDGHFINVPLELEVDGYHIMDDEKFNQADFLKRVKESPVGPKSACPSPEAYMKKMRGEEENVYVVTLSKELSGSYNSAVLAKSLYEEENAHKNIYIFNSCSASVGQTLIGMKIQELEEQGCSFEEVVEKTEEYIKTQHTFFVLETLDTLRKNGRLSNIKAFVANVLNIKPVMGSTDMGTIQQLGQERGMNKALKLMVEQMLKVTDHHEERVLAISHCNCPKRAQYVKEEIERVTKFKDIVVVDTAGVSSMYANDGGVIMTV